MKKRKQGFTILIKKKIDFSKIKENWICRKWTENGFLENHDNFYIYTWWSQSQ